MQAIGKYIVIKKINEEYKTDSGLLLSSADVESFRYHKGKVINPGNRVEVIKEGDTIYYDKSSGHSMLIEDETFTIIEERNVVIVV
ncbi:MAG: putative chaperonin 10 Kd subunit [Prokaryotic dsDNA virus sp.]|jgi:co-chaperonin GroES (HSP10)|nr:MAG: putative chaperonin 10 Kd subunit [Prokaryotic dsDNA virus sp.]|tara:strand:+ start:39817 stop:40074 length:258 start_codon:yes stop_codon:yes gene_type:complete